MSCPLYFLIVVCVQAVDEVLEVSTVVRKYTDLSRIKVCI
jgi:hypothetical protein